MNGKIIGAVIGAICGGALGLVTYRWLKRRSH